MPKFKILIGLLVTLTSCMAIEKPAVSSWYPVRDGIEYGISGIARVNAPGGDSGCSAGDACFLIVHDNKFPDLPFIGLVSISADRSVDYRTIAWPSPTQYPVDLEALTALPGTPGTFLACSSKGEVFRFEWDGATGELSLAEVFELPNVSRGMNIEGFAIAEVEGQLLAVWGDRGSGSEPGGIYWGTFDPVTNAIAPTGTVSFRVPFPENGRSISDLKIDGAGVLWVSAAVDYGDDGPFASAVYVAGVFEGNNEEGFNFRSNSSLVPLWRFDDRKIEAIELVPGEAGGAIFGTDDENQGSAVFWSW